MHIKRFEAATMAEAIDQVRQALGPDALILSSRTIRKGGAAFGLMGRTRVEVQAARERAADASLLQPVPRAPGANVEPIGAVAQAASTATGEDLIRELRRELAGLRGRERFEEEVRSELRGLRQALGGILGEPLRRAADPLAESLCRRGLEWMHAESLVSAWRAQAAGGGGRSLEVLLRERIEAQLAPPRPDEGGKVRILVGAPGVGKTTTLAKLAARDEEGEREVALVSLDHYRIGASEQLRAYAGLLESPFEELSDPADLPGLVDRLAGHAVLVDTAGRGAREEGRLAPLEPLREALGERASVELVVDATARPALQRAQLTRFAALAPDRLILTKTDECDSLADVANLLLEPGCPPVCWVGTGQRVPEDLAVVEAERIARDVLGEAA